VENLVKAVALIDTHRDDLGTFITADPQGQHLPTFLRHLARHLLDERNSLLEHLQVVSNKVEHIKEIVAMQQVYATAAGALEPLALATLMDDALKTHDDSLGQHEVEVVRDYAELPLVWTDRHKVLQILIHLIRNAKQALLAAASTPKQLTVRVGTDDGDQVILEVGDNGIGIDPADLMRIFQYGFTTKSDGHGFGLHSSALMAQELGGALTAHSEGVGQGAVFRLAFSMKEAPSCTV
jgi:signal transduction histidine kinase